MAIFEFSELDLVPIDSWKREFHKCLNQWSILNQKGVKSEGFIFLPGSIRIQLVKDLTSAGLIGKNSTQPAWDVKLLIVFSNSEM